MKSLGKRHGERETHVDHGVGAPTLVTNKHKGLEQGFKSAPKEEDEHHGIKRLR